MKSVFIFDIDGVILPIEQTWVKVTLEILTEYEINLTINELLNEINKKNGSNYSFTTSKILNYFGKGFLAKEAISKINKVIELTGFEIDSNTSKLIDFIRCTKSIFTGIVTNRNKIEVCSLLKILNAEEVFNVVVTRDDVEPNQLKPKPNQILKALDILKENPINTFYLGDTLDDLFSARDAQINSVLIKSKYLNFNTLKRISKYSNFQINRDEIVPFIIQNTYA
jgi:phosphoglycolate phosphatase-like HAD superfamily hydrolase